jgi:hypothetical protein
VKRPQPWPGLLPAPRLRHTQRNSTYRRRPRPSAPHLVRCRTASQLPLEQGSTRALQSTHERRKASQDGSRGLRSQATHLRQRCAPTWITLATSLSPHLMVGEPVEGEAVARYHAQCDLSSFRLSAWRGSTARSPCRAGRWRRSSPFKDLVDIVDADRQHVLELGRDRNVDVGRG